MRFALFSILCFGFAYITSSDAYLFDPKAVDALLREIRARLQEKGVEANARKVVQETEEIQEDALMQAGVVEGSGEDEQGSGEVLSTAIGVPVVEKEEKRSAKTDSFPRPEPIFDKYGNLKSKDQLEALTYTNFKKQAPATLQEHYNLNPIGTLQMLQGLDVHGASGGYHRALSGGYLPPATYDPYNVNWHSYGDEGVKMKDKAISIFRHVVASEV